MAVGDTTNQGRRIRHIPDDRSRQVSDTRRTDDARRRATDREGAQLVDGTGETVSDIVDLLREFSGHIHDDLAAKLVQDAADEIDILRQSNDDLDERCTKLRERITTWVTATDNCNKAMWTKDLTTEQRLLIEIELTRSINLLIVEAAPRPLKAVGR
jgi:hypothetical protein